MDLTQSLDVLSECMAARDAENLHRQELIDQILTPEIKQAIADVEAEFTERFASIDKSIAELTETIKAEVKLTGTTAKGQFLQAVFSKGRVSWDTKSLDKYAITHPELADLRKEGEPSVSIRVVGK